MTLLGGKREKPRPRRPKKNSHAPLKEVGELEAEKNPGFDREITPRIYDRPPCLTHTHTSNTTYTNFHINSTTSITLSFLLHTVWGSEGVTRKQKFHAIFTGFCSSWFQKEKVLKPSVHSSDSSDERHIFYESKPGKSCMYRNRRFA